MNNRAKKNIQSSSEKYAQLLASSPESQSAISTTLNRLGFDENFIFVSALINELSNSFAYFITLSPKDEVASYWAEVWSEAKSKIDELPSEFPAQVIPAVGGSSNYPILTVFARKVPLGCEFIHCCRVIFFKALIAGQPKINPSNSKQIARQLKLSTVTTDPRSSYVEKLKLTKGGLFEDYIEGLKTHLEAEAKNKKLISQEKLLVNALSQLLDFDVPQKSVNGSRNQGQINNDSGSGSVLDIQIEAKTQTNETSSPINGTIRQVSSSDSSENVFDSPDPIFEAEVTSNDGDFEPNDIANLNRSLRWMHNTRAISPSSPQRLNRIERAKFLVAVRGLVADDFETAIVLYLQYLFGLNIDEVWSLKFDQDIDLATQGVYLRDLPSLGQAYTPAESLMHLFEKKIDCIELSLPRELTLLLNRLPRNNGEFLVGSFKRDRHEIKDRVQDKIDDWRKGGNSRLHYNRTMAALSTELMILTNDPVVAYLLSGETIHLSPTLRFYRATSKAQLHSYWNASMDRLLQLTSN